MLSKNMLLNVKELRLLADLAMAIGQNNPKLNSQLEKNVGNTKKIATVLKKANRLIAFAIAEDRVVYDSHKPLKIKEVFMSGELDPKAMTDTTNLLLHANTQALASLGKVAADFGEVFFIGADENYYTLAAKIVVERISDDDLPHWQELTDAQNGGDDVEDSGDSVLDVPGLVPGNDSGKQGSPVPGDGEESGRDVEPVEDAIPEGAGAER